MKKNVLTNEVTGSPRAVRAKEWESDSQDCSKTSDRTSYLKDPAKNVLTSFRRPTCCHPLVQF